MSRALLKHKILNGALAETKRISMPLDEWLLSRTTKATTAAVAETTTGVTSAVDSEMEKEATDLIIKSKMYFL